MNIPDKDWGPKLACHGGEDMASFADPLAACLKPDRSRYPHALFLAGDSHGAQIKFMMDAALVDTNYQSLQINMESPDQDVYGFIDRKPEKWQRPEVFEYILSQMQAGDVMVLTYAANRTIRISEDRQANGQAVWAHYLEEFTKRKGKVVLVGDSPIFPKVPPESCMIAMRYLSLSHACQIDRESAEKQRSNQTKMFKALTASIPDVFYFDLLPLLCGPHDCHMIEDDRLRFIDYSHISEATSYGLALQFKNLLEGEMGLSLTK